MTDEQTRTAQLEDEPMTVADEPMTDAAEGLADVDEVIERESAEDLGDLDEPQAGEVEEAEGDTIEEGEVETETAREDAIDAADDASLDEGIGGTASADEAAADAAAEVDEAAAAAEPTETDAEPSREPARSAEAQQAARLSREAPLPIPDANSAAKQWYVIHTYSGYENKVKANLEHRIESMGVEDQIFQVLVPMEEEIEIKNGQRQTVNKKVFPGYVLVEMAMTDESWYVVRNTPGVTSFVGSGNRPTPLDRGRGQEDPQADGGRGAEVQGPVRQGPERARQGRPVRRVHRHRRRGQPGEATRSRCWSASSGARRRSSSTSCRSRSSRH